MSLEFSRTLRTMCCDRATSVESPQPGQLITVQVLRRGFLLGENPP